MMRIMERERESHVFVQSSLASLISVSPQFPSPVHHFSFHHDSSASYFSLPCSLIITTSFNLLFSFSHKKMIPTFSEYFFSFFLSHHRWEAGTKVVSVKQEKGSKMKKRQNEEIKALILFSDSQTNHFQPTTLSPSLQIVTKLKYIEQRALAGREREREDTGDQTCRSAPI